MRTKKALINVSVNIISFVVSFIPNLIIRKLFLESLGNEMLGLNSLYNNIINWMSILEMGVGTAIIFSLYKPYADNDKQRIRAYIRFYGNFYRCVGLAIIILGIIILPFLKYFIKDGIDMTIVNIGFILVLTNSLVTYMFSHRLCILNVAQETYKITIGTMISKLTIALIQLIVLKLYPSFILFISAQVIVNLIYYIGINLYITKKYEWIDKGKNTLEKKEKVNLIKNVKAMFIHKIGTLVVNSTDNIVISKFVGLSSLANYTNYQVVISGLQSLVSMVLSGLTPSIGNMLIENNKLKAYDIHKKIFFINFWIVSFSVISLYNTLNQFVGIWIGEDYLLDTLTFVVILINMYFSAMRGSVEQFQSASGNFYQDRYAAFAESAINLIFSLILVNYIGIAGVFIGTLISNFSIIFWTKPYIVYKYVFDIRLIEYFKMYFKYFLIALIPLTLTQYITMSLKLKYEFKYFIINCFLNIIIINLTYILIFFRTSEFRYYLDLLKRIKKNKTY